MHLFSAALTEPELLDALVIELVRGYSLKETLEHVYKIDSKKLAISQTIIARAPVATPIDPTSLREVITDQTDRIPRDLQFLCEKPNDLKDAFVRFPNRPVHLLFSHDYGHFLSANLNPTSTINPLDRQDVNSGNIIRTIRTAEIDAIVEAGRARFPAIPGMAYEAPSGHLVPSFLRIGNIQRSRAAVDAIFFWLLPYLKGCSGIITDTWSIGSIALNASRRLSSYRAPFQRPCPVEMVSSYLDGSEESATEAADHIERLLRITSNSPKEGQEERKVIFLMSAINTGELHARTSKLLDDRRIDPENVLFVSLFNLGISQSTIPCIADWSAHAGHGAFAPIHLSGPTERLDTIKIDPQTYFPTSYKDILHGVREKEVENFREFLDRYPDLSAIRVHRNVTNDGATRHHAISIDTVALCAHAKFQERLTDKLTNLEPPPRLIITPAHDAGNILAGCALEVLRKREPHVQHVMHADLVLTDDRIAENTRILDLINGIDDHSSILILDDAFISGRRLNHYQLALRHVAFRGRFHYLVAVARPEALSAWEYRCRMLKARPPNSPYAKEGNTVSAVEAFALPDWNEEKCPWCNELRAYQTFSNREGQRRLSLTLRNRRQLLERSMHAGLTNDLFLTPQTVPNLSFTRDSKFAALGTSQASVFASVASGVQTLRTPDYENRVKRPALGPRHYPVATVLNYDEYLFGTYSDSLLRACLLRAARDYELVYTDVNEERKKTERAIQLMTSMLPIENDVSAEIIIAVLAKKFPELNLGTGPVLQALVRLGLVDAFGEMLETAS